MKYVLIVIAVIAALSVQQSAAFATFINLTAQACGGQDNSATQNLLSGACDGSYPGNCNSTHDLVSCNDGNSEVHTTAGNNDWAGVNLTYFNTSVNCEGVTVVKVCFERWTSSASIAACSISVDNDATVSWVDVNTTCPGTTANPGVVCQAVTSSEDWSCSNFFGSSGTRAKIKSQAQQSTGGSRTLTWDVLFYEVNYTPAEAPSVTGLKPAAGSGFIGGQAIEIAANVTDNVGVSTVTANITYPNSTVQQVTLTLATGSNYNSSFTIPLVAGRYNVTFIANDTSGYVNSSQTTNFNATLVNLTIVLLTPTAGAMANVTQNDTFSVAANITCGGDAGGSCGNVTAYARRNSSGFPSGWFNTSYSYRRKVTFANPQSLGQNNTHVLFSFTLAAGRLSNENGTLLVCSSAQVPFDGYGTSFSGNSVTGLEGLAELNFTESETKTCYIYYDPVSAAAELLPSVTGWGTACDNNYAVCGTPGDITTSNVDLYSTATNSSFPGITCGADAETFTYTQWCYFKAPSTGATVFATSSDDGSELFLNETLVVNNRFCQATTCRSANYTITTGRYYRMKVGYDENSGSNDLYALFSPNTCASGAPTGNWLDNECYPYLGDEWQINGTVDSEESGGIPVAINTTAGATPLFTASAQPLTCLLDVGQSCIVNWTVNASGAVSSRHNLTVNATSNNTALPFVVSANATVRITGFAGTSVAFTVYIPADNATGYSTAALSSTEEIIFNTTVLDSTKVNATAAGGAGRQQNSTNSIFRYENSGTVSLNITLAFLSSPACSGGTITVKAAWNYTNYSPSCSNVIESNCTNITTSAVRVANLSNTGDTRDVWLWADFSSCSLNLDTSQTLNHTSVQS
jgi:hypothetical protein